MKFYMKKNKTDKDKSNRDRHHSRQTNDRDYKLKQKQEEVDHSLYLLSFSIILRCRGLRGAWYRMEWDRRRKEGVRGWQWYVRQGIEMRRSVFHTRRRWQVRRGSSKWMITELMLRRGRISLTLASLLMLRISFRFSPIDSDSSPTNH